MIDLLLAHLSISLQIAPISDLRWLFPLLEHLSLRWIAIEGEEVNHKLDQLLLAYSDLVSHIMHVLYPRLHEKDQGAFLRMLITAPYVPQEPQLEELVIWLQTQLDDASSSPLLTLRLLTYLTALSTDVTLRSTKIVLLLNPHLLSEHFQVSAAALTLLSTLIQQNHSPILQAIESSNSIEYAIESFLDMVSNSSKQQEETIILDVSLDALPVLHSAIPLPFAIHSAEICECLAKIIVNHPEIATKTLQVLVKILRDESVQHSLGPGIWLRLVEECAYVYRDRIDMAGLLFDVARGAISTFDEESLPTLYNAVLPFATLCIGATTQSLYETSVWPLESLIETLEALFDFGCAVKSDIIFADLLDNVIEPFIFDNINELVKYPALVNTALDWFIELASNRKALLPHLVHLLLSGSLLSVVSAVDTWIPGNTQVHQLLFGILCSFFCDDALCSTSAWESVLLSSKENFGPESRTILHGGLYELEERSNEKISTFLDLAFVALIVGDDRFLSYLLESRSAFGTMSSSTSWKVKLKWTLSRILNDVTVYAFDYGLLVRACFLWSSCYTDYSDPTADTNVLLLEALAGRRVQINYFVPASFNSLSQDSLFPTSLITWLVDHSTQGSSVILLAIVKESMEISSPNWFCTRFAEVASTLPKFAQLLTSSYTHNLVIKPVLEPLAALKCISILCVLPSTDSPLDRTKYSHEVTPIAKLLINSPFPYSLPREWIQEGQKYPTLPLASLLDHILVVRQVLIAEIRQLSSLAFAGSKRSDAAVFAKYWKSLESLLCATRQWSEADIAKSGDTDLWNLVDSVSLQLLNIWMILFAFFKPPPDLVKHLLKGPSVPHLWCGFRNNRQCDGAVSLHVMTLAPSAKKRKLLQMPLQPSNLSHLPPPPQPQYLIDAVLVSMHQIWELTQCVGDTIAPNHFSKRVLLQLKSLLAGNPFTNMIAVGSLTSEALRYLKATEKSAASPFQGSNEESSLLSLTIISSLLNQAQDFSTPFLCEYSIESLLKLSCSLPSDQHWLKLPQTLHLLTLVIAFPQSQLYGGALFSSCFLLSVVLACSRVSPGTVPKQIASLITSPRLARVFLQQAGTPRLFLVTAVTVYTMIRCGMWRTLLKRAGRDANSILLSIRSIVHQCAETSQDAFNGRQGREFGLFEVNGVLIADEMIDCLKLFHSTHVTLGPVSRAKILQQWL